MFARNAKSSVTVEKEPVKEWYKTHGFFSTVQGYMNRIARAYVAPVTESVETPKIHRS